jgi:adenine-specific DNA-methyltransferase
MMMAKRSHLHPRVIVNEADVLTTDTIYRGRLISKSSLNTWALTAGFHNSLTLLTSEIEGRSFGGGVLELVPSEISRLLVPISEGIAEDFDRLDCICRNASEEDVGESLVRETDQLLVKRTRGLVTSLMDQLQDARSALLRLRLARN